jgi:hypothetical protein
MLQMLIPPHPPPPPHRKLVARPTQCCGSGMFIPDPNPNFFHPGSRIRIKELFLSSRKYDPGCSSRIRILIFYPSPIPDPGFKKAPDPGSGSATLVDEGSIKLLHCHFTGEPAPGGSDPPHQPEEDHRRRAELAPEAALPGRGQRQGGGPLQASSVILEKCFFRVSIFRKCFKNFFMYAF